ncbi:MAG: nrdJ, partial [Verrucomicrobia bacterium]|nr:nrdJ [Verrucomicrobiota bacterium]
DAYVQAWKMGLKCVAIYRDGSKRSQPLNTKKTNEGGNATAEATTTASEQVTILEGRIGELEGLLADLRRASNQPLRRRLPETRMAMNHKFDIAGHEGYLTVGLFDDGRPGELFITMAKEGSTIGGLMDSVATLTSMSLQYGVPLEALVKKFSHQRFEPSGFTKNPEIRNTSSIIDYVFRWMALQFIPGYREMTNPKQTELPMPDLMQELKKKVNKPVADLPLAEEDTVTVDASITTAKGSKVFVSLSETVSHMMKDAPTCPSCGHLAVRNGACFKCINCGESLGCS